MFVERPTVALRIGIVIQPLLPKQDLPIELVEGGIGRGP